MGMMALNLVCFAYAQHKLNNNTALQSIWSWSGPDISSKVFFLENNIFLYVRFQTSYFFIPLWCLRIFMPLTVDFSLPPWKFWWRDHAFWQEILSSWICTLWKLNFFFSCTPPTQYKLYGSLQKSQLSINRSQPNMKWSTKTYGTKRKITRTSFYWSCEVWGYGQWS